MIEHSYVIRTGYILSDALIIASIKGQLIWGRNLSKIWLAFWEIWRHQNFILRLTDLSHKVWHQDLFTFLEKLFKIQGLNTWEMKVKFFALFKISKFSIQIEYWNSNVLASSIKITLSMLKFLLIIDIKVIKWDKANLF